MRSHHRLGSDPTLPPPTKSRTATAPGAPTPGDAMPLAAEGTTVAGRAARHDGSFAWHDGGQKRMFDC